MCVCVCLCVCVCVCLCVCVCVCVVHLFYNRVHVWYDTMRVFAFAHACDTHVRTI